LKDTAYQFAEWHQTKHAGCVCRCYYEWEDGEHPNGSERKSDEKTQLFDAAVNFKNYVCSGEVTALKTAALSGDLHDAAVAYAQSATH
jgi:hypothetical protein